MRFLLLMMMLISHSCFAENNIISEFMNSKHIPSTTGFAVDTERRELQSYYQISNGSYLVHWVYMISNYWQHRFSLIINKDDEIKELDRISIDGLVEGVEVIDSVLSINYLSYKKDDPRCCPSLNAYLYYVVHDKSLMLIEKKNEIY